MAMEAPAQNELSDKYKNAKAISSDQMFGGNEVQPVDSSVNTTKIHAFGAAKSISSDAFFDKETGSSGGAGGFWNKWQMS